MVLIVRHWSLFNHVRAYLWSTVSDTVDRSLMPVSPHIEVARVSCIWPLHGFVRGMG
jgi:hypothetical protein